MPREAAWSVLRSGSETPLRAVERAVAERGLDERDARLVRRLVGVEVRRRGTLRALVRAFAHGKLKPELVAHLHLGLVQLLYLDRIPEHAIFSTTLDAVHRTVAQSKVRVVDGILRAALRARREGTSGDPRRDLVGRPWHFAEPVFHDAAEHPLLWAEDALSMPAPILRRWTNRQGRERAEALARLFLDEPPLALRVVRGEREALMAELSALGVDTVAGVLPTTLRAPSEHTAAVMRSPAFREGRLTVQGESAVRAAELMQARPGEELADLCAAPGGKTAVLAGAGATVTACDLDPRRLALLGETVERLGVAERVHAAVSDGIGGLAPDATFDGVLVDAPCTNTGVLGARPGARWRFGPKVLAELTRIQERLLAEGASRVRPGGRLVWSTCSLEPEENAQLLRAFLARKGRWELEEEHDSLPGPDGPSDGGYAARLRLARD